MIIPEHMGPGSRYKKNDLKTIPSTFSLAKVDIAFASNGAGHVHKYFMQLLFPLLKPCHQAGSSTWAECSGEGWGAWLQPCSWGALLWWLHCGSPLPWLLLFLPKDGMAPGREAEALNRKALPSACSTTHPYTMTVLIISGSLYRAQVPPQADKRQHCCLQFST